MGQDTLSKFMEKEFKPYEKKSMPVYEKKKETIQMKLPQKEKKKYITKKQKEKNDKLEEEASGELKHKHLEDINIGTTLNYDDCRECTKYYNCILIKDLEYLREIKNEHNLNQNELDRLFDQWKQFRIKQAGCNNSRRYLRRYKGYNTFYNNEEENEVVNYEDE